MNPEAHRKQESKLMIGQNVWIISLANFFSSVDATAYDFQSLTETGTLYFLTKKDHRLETKQQR